MTGMAFGLREPAILGGVRVVTQDTVDFAALDAAMADFVVEPLPDDLAGDSDAAKLVERLLCWAGAIQRQLHIPVFGRGHIRPARQRADGSQTISLAVPYFAPPATTAALTWVARYLGSFLVAGGQPQKIHEAARSQFDQTAATIKKHSPEGVNTFRLLKVADEQGVTARQFMPGIFCFGVGARSRWLQSSLTDRTSILAVKVAGSKLTAARLLRAAGLPVAPHALAKSAEDAINIARKIGYPVVIKPADRQQGKGVAADLKSDGEVAPAYERARQFSKNILVEKHFTGTDYRMTVIDGRLVRISCRRPFGVIGDGSHSVAELVDIAKQTPRHQQEIRERGKSLIDLDDEALALLAEQQLTRDSVIPEDRYVQLRKLANVSAGATGYTVENEDIHPDNHLLAIRAAAALRLDIAGADVIFPDITKSWIETGAHICEVNAQPQFGIKGAVDMLPVILDGNGRIPIMLVIGAGESIDWNQLRSRSQSALTLGFASRDGAWLGENRLTGRLDNAFHAAQILLQNIQAEAAVIVMSPGEVRRIGLPFDACNALVLDDPQKWDEEDRAALNQILEVALPHAERAITIAPLDGPTASTKAAAPLQTSDFGGLQQSCEGLLVELLKDGGHTRSVTAPT